MPRARASSVSSGGGSSSPRDASHLLNFRTSGPPRSPPGRGRGHHRGRGGGGGGSSALSEKERRKREESARRERAVRRSLDAAFYLHSSADHGFVLTRIGQRHVVGASSTPRTEAEIARDFNYSGPDVGVRWDAVRIVKCFVPVVDVVDVDDDDLGISSSSLSKCPICLDSSLLAPRMTKCGHSFCLPCVLRHLHSSSSASGSGGSGAGGASGGYAGRCPCCAVAASPSELRPVQFRTVSKPPTPSTAAVASGGSHRSTATTMTFVKLHRKKGCFAPFLPRPVEKASVVVDGGESSKGTRVVAKRSGPHAAPSSSDRDAPYCRFNYLDVDSYLSHLHDDAKALEYRRNELVREGRGTSVEAGYVSMASGYVNGEIRAAMETSDLERKLREEYERPLAVAAAAAEVGKGFGMVEYESADDDGRWWEDLLRRQEEEEEKRIEAATTDERSDDGIKRDDANADPVPRGAADADDAEAREAKKPAGESDASGGGGSGGAGRARFDDVRPSVGASKEGATANDDDDGDAGDAREGDDGPGASEAAAVEGRSGRSNEGRERPPQRKPRRQRQRHRRQQPRRDKEGAVIRHPLARLTPGSMHLEDGCTHFYQSIDGRLCFLSGFNVNCLCAEFSVSEPPRPTTAPPPPLADDEDEVDKKGDDVEGKRPPPTTTTTTNARKLQPLPDVVSGRVVETERVRLSPDVRKRFPFLSHLPLYCDVTFVELDLDPVLGVETKLRFKSESDRRRKRRKERRDRERREDRFARSKEKERIERLKSSVQRIDPDDDFFRSGVVVAAESGGGGADGAEEDVASDPHCIPGLLAEEGGSTSSTGPSSPSPLPSSSRTPPVAAAADPAFSFRAVCAAGGAFPTLGDAASTTTASAAKENDGNDFPLLSSSPGKRGTPPVRPSSNTSSSASSSSSPWGRGGGGGRSAAPQWGAQPPRRLPHEPTTTTAPPPSSSSQLQPLGKRGEGRGKGKKSKGGREKIVLLSTGGRRGHG